MCEEWILQKGERVLCIYELTSWGLLKTWPVNVSLHFGKTWRFSYNIAHKMNNLKFPLLNLWHVKRSLWYLSHKNIFSKFRHEMGSGSPPLFATLTCGVIQGFPALRKAITTHVKNTIIFHVCLIWLINCTFQLFAGIVDPIFSFMNKANFSSQWKPLVLI